MTVMDFGQAATPERTVQQRLDALERANRIRTRRAVMKRELKAGRVDVADLILEPPGYAETMKVLDLLVAVPKYGRVKSLKVLNRCRMSPAKTLGGLSLRQRGELVGMLGR